MFRTFSILTSTSLGYCLLAASAPLQSAVLFFDTVGGSSVYDPGVGEWSSQSSSWQVGEVPSMAPLSAWTPGSSAVFQTGGINTVEVSEAITVESLFQNLALTETTLHASAPQTLTLTGNTLAVVNEGNRNLTFGTNLTIALAATNAEANQEWKAGANAQIVVASQLTGLAGNSVTGGLEKTGEGTLVLKGANTYSGLTKVSAGVIQAGSATAFGDSQIQFRGGTLQYGAGVTQDFSSQFTDSGATGAYTIDTNGNHVTFATALSGSRGLVKRGDGILSLAAGSSFTGTVVVEAGVLRNNAGLAATNAFGAAGNLIDVRDGATVDIRWVNNAPTTPTITSDLSVKYLLTVTGKGVVDTSGLIYGGYVGAVTTSGGLSSTDIPFTEITMTGATTFSGGSRLSTDAAAGGGRYGITKINANGHDITFVNAKGISWRAGNNTQAQNVKNIFVEQGHIFADGNFFGDVAGGALHLNANSLGTSTVRGELRNYVSTKTVAKALVLNGGNIQFEGVPTTIDDAQTWTLSGTLTLKTNPLSRNTIRSEHFNRDIKITGKITGSNGFDYTGTTTGTGVTRYSVLTLTNAGNDFTGAVHHHRGIIRMSDGTNGGTLGQTSNGYHMGTAANLTILDLFGTSQQIGALSSVVTPDGTAHFIQNNRTNTTSTLTVGHGNASGEFYGTLRDYGTLMAGNSTRTNAAYTGDGAVGAVLSFRKVGSGTQTLRGTSTYTGDTLVEAGTLLVRNSVSGNKSATGTGNFLASGSSVVGGTGSITGGTSKSISLGAGTFLRVGNTHQANTGAGGAASQLLLGSSTQVNLELLGTVQIDLFGDNTGITNSEADRLILLTTQAVMLGGTLQVHDTTGTSTSWNWGSAWQIFDWSGVSQMNGAFTNFLLPTLQLGHHWDTSMLYQTGEIRVVPEPTRWALACAACIGFLARRRRAK